MGSAEERRSATWVRCLAIAIKIACAILVAASLVYLVVAGMHFAVISGLFSQAEIEGTRTIIRYCLALFALFLGAAATGIWACGDAEGLSRCMPICAGVALVPLALIAVAVGTSMFGVADSAFSSIGFIKWIDLSCGACAIVFAALAVAAWRLDAKAGAADGDDVADGDDAAGGEGVACGDDVAGSEGVACDDSATGSDGVTGVGASETDDRPSEEEGADRAAHEDGARRATVEDDAREEPDDGDLQEEPLDAGARAVGADDAEGGAAADEGVAGDEVAAGEAVEEKAPDADGCERAAADDGAGAPEAAGESAASVEMADVAWVAGDPADPADPADDALASGAAGDDVDEGDGEPLPAGKHWAGARRVFEDPDDFLFSDASARDWQWEDA